MTIREYMIHFIDWLRYWFEPPSSWWGKLGNGYHVTRWSLQWMTFPRRNLDNHIWTRRVDPDPEKYYTCLICGHVIGETELDGEEATP